MLLPSRCERTDWILIVARVSLTSNGSRALAADRQLDVAVDRAAHLLDRLGQGQPLHRVAVEMGDQVARLEPGAGRRRIVDRRDHLDQPVLHRHLDAEPAELAAGLHLHIVEVLGVQIVRVRIERGQHAVDRAFDQRVVGDVVDIFGAHPLEHVAEQVELLVGLGRVRRRGGADILAQRNSKSAAGRRRDQPQSLHSRTLWSPFRRQLRGRFACVPSSLLASHGWGSTGRPSRRNSNNNPAPAPVGCDVRHRRPPARRPGPIGRVSASTRPNPASSE